jgi:hypothetical protein
MYKMNTRLKKTPLPNQALSDPTNLPNVTGDTSSLPTFVSRGLQTDLEPPSSTQTRYYEKQKPQVRICHMYCIIILIFC